MAPEQLDNAPVTPATDVWGVGACLFSMLTGTPPRNVVGGAKRLSDVSGVEHAPLETMANTLSNRTVEAVKKALNEDPNERFDSCAAMIDALTDSVLHE